MPVMFAEKEVREPRPLKVGAEAVEPNSLANEGGSPRSGKSCGEEQPMLLRMQPETAAGACARAKVAAAATVERLGLGVRERIGDAERERCSC